MVFITYNKTTKVLKTSEHAINLPSAIKGAEALILAVPHEPYLKLNPDDIVRWAGGPLAMIDCFGILDDDMIRQYFKLVCEVKGLGRGHIQRIKEEVRKKRQKANDGNQSHDHKGVVRRLMTFDV
jgi:hypothetical protein